MFQMDKRCKGSRKDRDRERQGEAERGELCPGRPGVWTERGGHPPNRLEDLSICPSSDDPNQERHNDVDKFRSRPNSRHYQILLLIPHWQPRTMPWAQRADSLQ